MTGLFFLDLFFLVVALVGIVMFTTGIGVALWHLTK